ncbi:MAG: ABC transporter ATP-binding protein, partial [Dehalococcoidia bacterium]
MKVIEVQDLWKRYRLARDRAGALKELVPHLLRRGHRASPFWALRGMSFQVEQGERLGIMGPNGAGKTTLLKILAGVMHPTRGRIAVRGKVCPLIDLGFGFHPDLSGRDNIFLSGVILGLSRAQVKEKIPEIVAFAELDDFMDVPLKRYSTGMQLRLGFAIAVHAEPDILLVDEA